ncbi:MAG: hypothetical protein OEV35_05835, partial [Gallionellaceae bacterium]|nr:hypothetical protein [Gallionellaceae bacterium]
MDAGTAPFLPDLRAELPQELLLLPEEAEPLIRIKAERSKYQAALLRWLRNNHPADALHTMRATVQAITGCVQGARQRAFWWVASALLDCLGHGSLPDEHRAMLLLSRIDLQMKSLVDSQPADTDDTLREMLYLIAHSQLINSDIAAVKQAYALENQLPQPAA